MQDKTYMRGLLRDRNEKPVNEVMKSFCPCSHFEAPPALLPSYFFSDAYVLLVCGLCAQRICPVVVVLPWILLVGAECRLSAPSSLYFLPPSCICCKVNAECTRCRSLHAIRNPVL